MADTKTTYPDGTAGTKSNASSNPNQSNTSSNPNQSGTSTAQGTEWQNTNPADSDSKNPDDKKGNFR